MSDLPNAYPETARILWSLIDELSDSIDEENLELLRDFVLNNEYGVALEWLHAVLHKRSISVSETQNRAIEGLATRMDITLANK